MTRPRDVPAPLAELKGRSRLLLLEAPYSLFVLVPAALVSASHMGDLAPLGATPSRGTVYACSLALAALVAAVAHVAVIARSGWVEVFADRLVALRLETLTVVFFDDLLAFDDRSTAYLRLLVRPPPGAWSGPWSLAGSRAGSRRPRTLLVPTTDEEGRGVLLDVLARAGVPRAGGVREGLRAPSAPVLVASWPWWSGGSVVFREDRIDVQVKTSRLLRPYRPLSIGWDDVVGWRGDAPREVDLVLRRGLLWDILASDVPVPTTSPEKRAAVTALLESRGVPRV